MEESALRFAEVIGREVEEALTNPSSNEHFMDTVTSDDFWPSTALWEHDVSFAHEQQDDGALIGLGWRELWQLMSFSVQTHWCVNLLSHFFHFSYASWALETHRAAPPCFLLTKSSSLAPLLDQNLSDISPGTGKGNTAPSPTLQRLMSLSFALHLRRLHCMVGNSPPRLWGPSTITNLKQATVSPRARVPSARKEGHWVKLLAFILSAAIAL